MALRINRKAIIIIVIAVLLIGGGAAYAYSAGYFTPKQSNQTDQPDATGTAYKEKLTQSQTKVDELVAAGGKTSIEKADQIVAADVAAAEKSGNQAYITDAHMAQASLLIQTGRAQEALDSVLFPLEKKYSNYDEVLYDVYGQISWAYRELDQQDKANEYFNKIPGQGWN